MNIVLLAIFLFRGGLAQDVKPMSNFGYLALGYNIYYGNPRTSKAGVDPGFTTYSGSPVFQTIYSNGKSGDQRYAIPDGFSAVKDVGCVLDFTASSTTKSSNYTESLSVNAAVSASYKGETAGGSFKASGDYKSFKDRTQHSNQRMVSSTAECVVYYATVNAFAKPKFTDDFLAAIKQAPEDYGDGTFYFDIFDHFGTHVLDSAHMGSRYGFTSYFDEFAWTNVEKTGWGVTAAANYEGKFKAGLSGGGGNTKEAQEAFDSSMSGFQEISLGAPPVKGGDVTAWASAVVAEPMPIKYAMHSLCAHMDTETKRNNCFKAQLGGEYCTKRLMNERNALDSCEDAGDMDCAWDRDCHSGNVCLSGKCAKGAMSIAYRATPSLCLEMKGTNIQLNSCNGSPQQKWIFNTGEGQDYMQIQSAADTNQCMDGGAMTNGAALTVKHCTGGTSQTWAREILTGSIYLPNGPKGNVCFDAGSGIKAGKAMLVWECNVLPQQQFELTAPKSATVLV